MRQAAIAGIVLVALLHVYFAVLETFLWRKPFGRKVFGMSAEKAETTAVLASNQGLYNAFLAAGLLWAVLCYGTVDGRPILNFFLGCVAVAGVFGAATVSKKIFFIQAMPALVTVLLLNL